MGDVRDTDRKPKIGRPASASMGDPDTQLPHNWVGRSDSFPPYGCSSFPYAKEPEPIPDE
jgi:hypothetical protein